MSKKRSIYKQFLSLYKGGIIKHIDEINELLPVLIEKVPPDQILYICSDSISTSLLHILARYPDIHYELLFSYKGPIDCNILVTDKVTPLHNACYWGNEKAVNLLLDHGAQIDLVDPQVCSPLARLTLNDMTEEKLRILKLLIQHGADLNREWTLVTPDGDITKKSVISSCVYHLSVLNKGLSTFVSKKSNICIFLKELINGGARVNYVNEIGENALHIACFRDDMDLARILLENGCNHELANTFGRLPINNISSLEVKQQFLEMIELLHCR